MLPVDFELLFGAGAAGGNVDKLSLLAASTGCGRGNGMSSVCDDVGVRFFDARSVMSNAGEIGELDATTPDTLALNRASF